MATSVAELGVGDYDGQIKIISYGAAGAAAERQAMKWRPGVLSGVWTSEPRQSFRLKTDFPTASLSLNASTWIYMSGPNGPPGSIGLTGFGWTPQAIHRADAAYAAGLVLYEKLDYLLWTWADPNVIQVATVYYDLSSTDVMSGLISSTAASNLGTVVTGDVGVRKFHTTGWVASGIPTPQKAGILAPHLYAKGIGSAGPWYLEFLNAEWCWMGDPTP